MGYHYISVMGTMGCGKTTVAKLLAKRLGYRLIEENFGENAFLPRFYKNMKRWAFHSQTFFLMEKIQQLLGIKELLTCPSKSRIAGRSGIVQDTPIEQDVFSYAKAQHMLGNIDDAEWKLYQKIYRSFTPYFPKLSLIVYLETSLPVVGERIKNRGRGFEKGISLSYLRLLDRLNRQWLKDSDVPVVTIPTDNLNIVRNAKAQATLLMMVKTALKSLS